MTNSLVPKPFDVTDSKRAREEAARLAERRDGATWAGTAEVAKAVQEEADAREDLAAETEAEAQANRDAIVAEAQARADALIDVDTKLGELDSKYDGVITDAGQLGTRLETAEAELVAHEGRLDTADAELGTLTGVTLPALNADLAAAKTRLTATEGTLAPLPGKVATAQADLTLLKDTTIPALGADLTAAKTRLTTAEGTLAPLPGKVATAQADLTTAFGQISTADGKATAAQERADAATTAAAEAYKSVANMVVNGSFEQGWLGWSREGTGGTIDSTVGYDGTASFKTNNTGGASQAAFPAKQGDTWRYSWWYKTEAGYVNAPGGLRLRGVSTAGVHSDVASSTLSENAGWAYQSIEYVIPAGITHIYPRFAFALGGASKYIWVDSLKLENVTAVKALEAAAAAAQAAAVAAQTAAGVADGKAVAAAAAASTAQTKADTAKTAADQAAADALAASGIAKSKGKTLIQSAAPAAADRNTVTLWIDTTGGANTPKRWTTGTTWVAVTDKAATDAATAAANAASAAAAADAKAVAAQTAAGNAQSTATAALTMAGSKSKVYYDTAAPSGVATGAGDLWRQRDAANNIIGEWRWNGEPPAGSWIKTMLSSDTISNLDVGKLTAGAATIDTAVINKMAVQIATIIQLNADRITAGKITSAQVDTTNLAASLATILSLNADRITAGTLGAERINVAELAVSIATVIQLNASAITAGTIATARLNVTDLAANLATILSLNADRITAGTINTARLNASAIAAATAAFQTVDVKNLFATTGTMAEAVIAKLWTDVVMSRKITTQMLAVGAFDNVIPDPTFSNAGGDWGSVAAPYSFPPTEGYNGGPAFKVAPNSIQAGRYSKPIPMTGGAAYRVTVWVKSNVAIPAGSLGVYVRSTRPNGGGTPTGNQLKQTNGAAGNDAIAANTWTKLNLVATFDPAAVAGEVGFFTQTSFTTGTVWWSLVSATRMNAGELTVDGTVTAKALETELVLATKIVAGDPASTHAEMSPLGFKVFASPAGGGTPTEVVRLGVADTDDYFAITKGDGTLVASISQDGVVVGDQLNATSALWYKGDEMTAILDRMPRGIVAAGYRGTSSTVNASYGNIIPYLRVEAVLYPGRVYKVWTSGIKLGLDAGTRVTVGIKFANNGNLATISSNGLTETASGTDLEAPIVQELFAVGTEQTVSFLLFLQVLNSGQAGFRGSGAVPTRLVVEDAGPLTSQIDNGVHMNGTVAPPPAVNTYKKQYGSTGSMNYQGSNAQYNYDTGHMYQGLSPAGMGNTKSISIHPSMTADLSGATINYVRVYFNFGHWYYNAGGTARIGLHGHASIPASFSGSGIVATSGGWPRPGARWVDLPSSVFAGFKSGAYKGVYLEGDGTYGTYGIADRPTIEIGYTK